MIDDPVLEGEQLLDKSELMKYITKFHLVDKDKATVDNVSIALIYRSAFYWHVKATRKILNDDNYDYREFVLDYIESRISQKEMDEKYSNAWFRQAKRMGLRRSKSGMEKAKQRRIDGAIAYDNSEANRKPLTELEKAILDASVQTHPIEALAGIDYNALSDDLDENGKEHLILLPYENHELQAYDDNAYIDPYVDDGGRIIRKEVLARYISKPVKSIATILGVNEYEVYRSAFYWHMHTGKSSDDLHGDYAEFVQDYVDARIGNNDFALKYGRTARKRAYKMKLVRSDIGEKRNKLRQSGKLVNTPPATPKSKARKILDAILEIGVDIADMDARIISMMDDAEMSESTFIRANGMRISPYDFRRFEYISGIFLDNVKNAGISTDINPNELYHLAAEEYLTREELSSHFNVARDIIRATMSFYNIVPDCNTDEFNDKRGLSYRNEIDGYDSMNVVEKRKATYKYRTGYDSPLKNPLVREQSMDTLEQKTGFRKIGAANPVIKDKIIKTRIERGMAESNFESTEWQSKYGGHGFSNGPSEDERKIMDMINSLGVYNSSYSLNNRSVLHGRELDFYFKDSKFAIEVSPSFTHNSNEYEKSDIFSPKTGRLSL